MSNMSDFEAGQLVEQVRKHEAIITAQAAEIAILKSAVSYGRGVMAGAVLAASALGGFIGWLLGKLM